MQTIIARLIDLVDFYFKRLFLYKCVSIKEFSRNNIDLDKAEFDGFESLLSKIHRKDQRKDRTIFYIFKVIFINTI